MKKAEAETYGLLAEFEDADELLVAIRRLREAGFTRLDAYSPFPVEGLSEALGFVADRVPLVTLCGGIVGGVLGYGMQWYSNVIDYPINVAGRPMHSWPAFVPVTFELTVLFGALGAALGMFWLNGLPQTFHPVFTQENFVRASKDRFFVSIQASDPKFHGDETKRFLLELGGLHVSEVPHEP